MIFRVMLCACLIAIVVLGTSGCTQDDAGQTLQVEAYKGTEPIVFTGSGSITFTPRIVYFGYQDAEYLMVWGIGTCLRQLQFHAE